MLGQHNTALTSILSILFDIVQRTPVASLVSSRVTVSAGWPLVWKTWKCPRNSRLSGNVRDFTKSQGNVGKNLVRENLLKTVYSKLHICVHTRLQVFSIGTGMI